MKTPIVLLPLFLAACPYPVTHDGFVARAAIATCESEASCGDIGEDGDWETVEDCLDGMEDAFDAAWPEDDCQPEDIDLAAWDNCLKDAREAACDDGFFDTVDAFDACRAAIVCAD